MKQVKRQRLIYIILALVLGGIGVHNFYAGRMTPAVIQLILGLTLVLCWVSIIWAIIDIITVTKDGSGAVME